MTILTKPHAIGADSDRYIRVNGQGDVVLATNGAIPTDRKRSAQLYAKRDYGDRARGLDGNFDRGRDA